MHHFIAGTIFYILNVLLFPVTLLGYTIWIGSLVLNRRSGVSATAQGPLSARWFAHNLGTRQDEVADRLMDVLPGVPPVGPRLVLGPLLFAHRLTGYVPQTFRYPFRGNVSLRNQAAARQTFYDSVVERYLTVLPQFVILGAGFDTRAFRLPKAAQVRCFEVDTLKTQTIKQQMLRQAGIDTSNVTFVAADFEKQDWLNQLVAAGFHADRPTLFLWEGVTPYLDRTAVEDTLCKIGSTAQGSVIAFDYLTTEVLKSQSLYLRIVRASLQVGGEPLKFAIESTPSTSKLLVELLRTCRLSLQEQRIMGTEAEGEVAWGGFVTAMVSS